MRPILLVHAWLLALPGAVAAPDTCIVSGRILGHDGRPLPKAAARVLEPGVRAAITDREGRFTLVLPRSGARVLNLSGVYHRDVLVPVFANPSRPVEIDVRLATVDYRDRFDTVRVTGDFNGYSEETAVPMGRRPDGTFAATIPCEAESLRYQLLGLARDGRPTAGTMADTFFVRDRWICSVRAGGKPVEVVFDPQRLPRSGALPVVRFADPRSESGRLHPLFAEQVERDRRLAAAAEAHRAAGGDPGEFRWDASADARALSRQIGRERDPFRRHYLLLMYGRYAGGEKDSTLALRVLREVPPASPLWSLVPGGPGGVLWPVQAASRRPDLVRRYLEAGSEAHPDTSMRAGFLLDAMMDADQAGDRERLGGYYTRMMAEFPGSFEATYARNRFAPDRAIRVGQPAPAFGFSGLEDSTVVYRVADFRGKFLLLDFWAVWCSPCLVEMPHLHRAHEGFKDRGLVLLSVSFDPRRETVTRYRQGKWPMPWLHAFAGRGFAGEEARLFEILGIPRPILVDPGGTIVAVESELRGEKLQETLARLLPATAAKGP